MFDKPTIEDFKAFFYRAFPFQPTPDPMAVPPIVINVDEYVQDQDITNAFKKADTRFNEEAFGDQESYTLGYLYLAAHYLALDLRAAGAGYAGSFSWGQTSKSVGSVSVSQNLPGGIMTSPLWAWLTSTTFGVEYFMMIQAELIGQIGIAPGRTLP